MNLNNPKIFYKPWPHLVIENFLSDNFSRCLKDEILNFKNIDDKVMINRERINKGSKNFKKIINTNYNSHEIFKFLNDIDTFKKIYNYFDTDKIDWTTEENLENFSQNYYGKQYDSITEKLIKFLVSIKILNTSLNLDFDFSVSEKGYYREPHRDRETRILNFLIYLNSFKEEDGGAFELYNYKNNFSQHQNSFPRFPNNKSLGLEKLIYPKQGTLVAFLSTPNSYHAASELLTEKNKRVFIYGSYSLNKKVNWKKNC